MFRDLSYVTDILLLKARELERARKLLKEFMTSPNYEQVVANKGWIAFNHPVEVQELTDRICLLNEAIKILELEERKTYDQKH
jgi:hypothetical protein